MARVLSKLFRYEVEGSDGPTPSGPARNPVPLFTRWYLTPEFSKIRGLRWLRWVGEIIVHKFERGDCDRYPHNHRRVMLSLCLRGWYREEYVGDPSCPMGTRTHRAGRVRWMPLRLAHRVVEVSPGGCWTLVWRGPSVQDWGFVVGGQWVHWRDYFNVR